MRSRAKSVMSKVTDQATKGIELNGLGSAEVLPIDSIIVDPEYQRDLRHDLVNKIARNYDIVKAGPILVSDRDGVLYCVDGQHRIAGALQAGETEIFAHVVHGLTQEQEAELRLARNDRRSDSTYEKFRTRLVMKDPKAERMMEICEQLGAPINLEPNMHAGINALSTVEQLYDIDGTGVWLQRVLRCLKEAFGDELGGRNVSVSMMKATAWFIDRHVDRREVGWSDYVGKIGQVGVEDLDRKARAHKAAMGGSLWLNYYRAMVETWNFGRREGNKLHWKVQGSVKQLGGQTDGGKSWPAGSQGEA